jgi:hypothetical protein
MFYQPIRFVNRYVLYTNTFCPDTFCPDTFCLLTPFLSLICFVVDTSCRRYVLSPVDFVAYGFCRRDAKDRYALPRYVLPPNVLPIYRIFSNLIENVWSSIWKIWNSFRPVCSMLSLQSVWRKAKTNGNIWNVGNSTFGVQHCSSVYMWSSSVR